MFSGKCVVLRLFLIFLTKQYSNYWNLTKTKFVPSWIKVNVMLFNII
jgi:hypothetical protein